MSTPGIIWFSVNEHVRLMASCLRNICVKFNIHPEKTLEDIGKGKGFDRIILLEKLAYVCSYVQSLYIIYQSTYVLYYIRVYVLYISPLQSDSSFYLYLDLQ